MLSLKFDLSCPFTNVVKIITVRTINTFKPITKNMYIKVIDKKNTEPIKLGQEKEFKDGLAIMT
ncbi:hypothetical protein CXF71_15950 [Colwellia sp. 12G3]|nr:hypothetical protein CXF71_15950 [Colwellia sp. 12G3]